jgi:hypothetical protein
MVLRTAPTSPEDALEGKVNRIMEIAPLVQTLCEGVRLGVGLCTLVPLTKRAGISGKDAVQREVIRRALSRCVGEGMLTDTELNAWERIKSRAVNTRAAIDEHQQWVRQQQEHLMGCRCHPRLDSILRLVHNGKKLQADDIPWDVIAQAMCLVDDEEWTPEMCQKQAPFRSKGHRKKEHETEGQVPEKIISVAARIVELRKGDAKNLAEYLQKLLDRYEKSKMRLSPFQFSILRTLFTILTMKVGHVDSPSMDVYHPLMKRAEALLHPDGPQGEAMGCDSDVSECT